MSLLPESVERAPPDLAAGASAAEWRTWYEGAKARVVSDPTTKRYEAAAR